MQTEVQAARRTLVRNAAIFTPLFILALVGLVLTFLNGTFVLMAILVFVGFLFGYQAVQYLRDLGEEPASLSGAVQRKWTRSDFLIFGRTNYVMVGRQVFQIPEIEYRELKPQDAVEVTYFPHTNTVVTIRRTSREERQ